MSKVPSFLRGASRMAEAPGHRPIRAGSFALLAQGAPWAFSLLHDRPDHVLLWVTRGQGRVIVNGVRRGVSMHNAVFLPAGTLFAIDLPAGTQALCMQSPAGLTGQLPREPLLLRVKDSLAQAELTGGIDAMSRELTQNRPLLQAALEAHVRLIAVWLHRQVAAGAADVPRDGASVRLTRRFAQSVVRDFRTPRNMGDYAEALDVTPTHLTRVCKTCCGKTAADILTERKLHAARLALQSPRPAVQEIAQSLGFSSPAYFTRFVQTHTGKSPTTLRREAQGRSTRA